MSQIATPTYHSCLKSNYNGILRPLPEELPARSGFVTAHRGLGKSLGLRVVRY